MKKIDKQLTKIIEIVATATLDLEMHPLPSCFREEIRTDLIKAEKKLLKIRKKLRKANK